MPERVRICEVSPRDGLQNEPVFVSTEDKVRLVDLLSVTGLRYIEAASFVSPRWVPQMADGADVLARIRRESGITYAALTPNLKGYDAAVAARADEVAIFVSASETFSQQNVNCSIEESLARYGEVCRAAEGDGVPVRGYVSCVVACPYEGPVDPEAVCRIATALLELGCREVSLGDTIGVATPHDIEMLLDVVLRHVPASSVAGHFHDTRGHAKACIKQALKQGLRVFDTSVGGAGGCPFAPGARGNVATEPVVQLLADEGYESGVNMEPLMEASMFIGNLLRRAA